jgi:hypothetical protein
LILILFEFDFEGFKKLSSSWVLSSTTGMKESFYISSRLEFKIELVTLVSEETKLTFKLITTFYVRDVTALEWGKVRVEL